METPIYDFVRAYATRRSVRLHMPGHKGKPLLGCEPLDITEIEGADDLFFPSGILAESEKNASSLFGCDTFYSTEGSSHCLRAMLCLAVRYSLSCGKKPVIAAARNAHRSFLSAAVLLDLEIRWLPPHPEDSYPSCTVTAEDIASLIAGDNPPTALFLTCPDYLGRMAELRALAEVCHRRGLLLLVDGAHGALHRFLTPSLFAVDCEADLVCTSAHKTLPVLTGGAYLHLSPRLPAFFRQNAKEALSLFGSSSPSYLILESLDLANRRLSDYPSLLPAFLARLSEMKKRLSARGYSFYGEDPFRLTVPARPYGYTGEALASLLRERGVECEYSDPDFTVLMLTPENSEDDFLRLEEAFLSVERREALLRPVLPYRIPRCVLSPREAYFSDREILPTAHCVGRILSVPTVLCPPAVPVVFSGEEIDREAAALLLYYGIETCAVVSERRGLPGGASPSETI